MNGQPKGAGKPETRYTSGPPVLFPLLSPLLDLALPGSCTTGEETGQLRDNEPDPAHLFFHK